MHVASEHQRAAAESQRNELILLQARASLEYDPTQTVAWLKTYPADGADWRSVQTLAAEAESAGIARHVWATGAIAEVEFAPDGRTVVLGGFDNRVEAWDAQLNIKKAELPFDGTLNELNISPDGREVVLAGMNRQLLLWNLETHATRPLGPQQSPVLSAHYSPNGRLLATSGVDYVRLFNLTDGTSRAVHPHHGSIYRLSFTHDGQHVVTSDTSGLIHVWDVANGWSHPLRGHEGAIRDFAITDDDALLASGSDDHTLRLWDLRHPGQNRILTTNSSVFTHIRFLPGSHRLVAASEDAVLTIIGEDGTVLQRFVTQGESISSLSVSADGCWIAAGDRAGVVQYGSRAPANDKASTGTKARSSHWRSAATEVWFRAGSTAVRACGR